MIICFHVSNPELSGLQTWFFASSFVQAKRSWYNLQSAHLRSSTASGLVPAFLTSASVPPSVSASCVAFFQHAVVRRSNPVLQLRSERGESLLVLFTTAQVRLEVELSIPVLWTSCWMSVILDSAPLTPRSVESLTSSLASVRRKCNSRSAVAVSSRTAMLGDHVNDSWSAPMFLSHAV